MKMKKKVQSVYVSCLDTSVHGKYTVTVIRKNDSWNGKEVKRIYYVDNQHGVIDMISDIANSRDFRAFMQLSVYPTISIARK